LGTAQNQPENLMKSLITKSGFWRFRQEKPLPTAVLADIDTRRSANASSSAFWDPEAALRRMGDDRELLCDMIDYFHQDSPSLLRQLGELIEAGAASESSRIAHSLRGLCANFDATAAIRVAADTETACRAGKFTDAAAQLNFLHGEIAKLSKSLTIWQGKNARRD
jgi:two-component system, sensor histidine kinase and response regulator